MRVELAFRGNLLERSLAVRQTIRSRVGFKVELVALVSARLDVVASQVLLGVFGEVPAAEILRHAFEEGDVDINGFAIVLH